MELFRKDGDAVGHVEIAADWQPAIECARLTGLRTRGVWAADASAARALDPLWHEERGEPYVRGFRVQFVSVNGTAWHEDFTTAYFRDVARAATASLAERGALAAGDDVLYRVLAYAQPPAPAQRESDALVTSDVPVALPMREVGFAPLVSESVAAHGDLHEGDFEVFVPGTVLEEAEALTRTAGDVETGGVLIGFVDRDVDRRDIAVEITALVPARHTVGHATSLTFTSDTWTDVRHAVALRNRGEQLVGWFHSHPQLAWCRKKGCSPEAQAQCASAAGFFSVEDVSLHRTVFPRAYTVALVMTHSIAGVRPRLFGWRAGRVQPRGYRILAQSPLKAHTHAATATA